MRPVGDRVGTQHREQHGRDDEPRHVDREAPADPDPRQQEAADRRAAAAGRSATPSDDKALAAMIWSCRTVRGSSASFDGRCKRLGSGEQSRPGRRSATPAGRQEGVDHQERGQRDLRHAGPDHHRAAVDVVGERAAVQAEHDQGERAPRCPARRPRSWSQSAGTAGTAGRRRTPCRRGRRPCRPRRAAESPVDSRSGDVSTCRRPNRSFQLTGPSWQLRVVKGPTPTRVLPRGRGGRELHSGGDVETFRTGCHRVGGVPLACRTFVAC